MIDLMYCKSFSNYNINILLHSEVENEMKKVLHLEGWFFIFGEYKKVLQIEEQK